MKINIIPFDLLAGQFQGRTKQKELFHLAFTLFPVVAVILTRKTCFHLGFVVLTARCVKFCWEITCMNIAMAVTSEHLQMVLSNFVFTVGLLVVSREREREGESKI